MLEKLEKIFNIIVSDSLYSFLLLGGVTLFSGFVAIKNLYNEENAVKKDEEKDER